MNSKILFIGNIFAVSKKTFEDKETVYAQFLNKKEDGGVEIQQIKITVKEDLALLKEGENIKITIKISTYQNKLFFTQTEPIIRK